MAQTGTGKKKMKNSHILICWQKMEVSSHIHVLAVSAFLTISGYMIDRAQKNSSVKINNPNVLHKEHFLTYVHGL
jgi:hypothetical protein